MIVLALALYSFRLLGYSFINYPMESLFFEVTKNLLNCELYSFTLSF